MGRDERARQVAHAEDEAHGHEAHAIGVRRARGPAALAHGDPLLDARGRARGAGAASGGSARAAGRGRPCARGARRSTIAPLERGAIAARHRQAAEDDRVVERARGRAASSPASTSPCSKRTSPDETSALDSWRAASTVACEKSTPDDLPRAALLGEPARDAPRAAAHVERCARPRDVAERRARGARAAARPRATLNALEGQSERAMPRRAEARASQYEATP